MPGNVDRVGTPTELFTGPGGGNRDDAQEGVYHGDRVIHESPSDASLLADAAEELTMQHGEDDEYGLKKLEEREFSAKSELSERLREVARKYLEGALDLGRPQDLAQLVSTIMQRTNPTPQEIKRQVGERYPDVSQQYEALAFLEESLTGFEGQEAALAAVQAAKAELEAERGPEIHAGLNVAADAKQSAQTGLADAQSLRDFYREMVLGYTDVKQAYDAMLAKYGPDRFPAAAAFLIQGLGADLQSPQPSRDPAQLKAVLDDLYFVQTARNTHQAFSDLCDKVSKLYQPRQPLDAHQLMNEILPLKDQRWIDSNKILGLADRAGFPSDEGKIYFLRELHGIVRRLPDKIFQTLDDRDRLKTALQQSLDTAIDREVV